MVTRNRAKDGDKVALRKEPSPLKSCWQKRKIVKSRRHTEGIALFLAGTLFRMAL